VQSASWQHLPWQQGKHMWHKVWQHQPQRDANDAQLMTALRLLSIDVLHHERGFGS
jgi:hypothetical protein